MFVLCTWGWVAAVFFKWQGDGDEEEEEKHIKKNCKEKCMHSLTQGPFPYISGFICTHPAGLARLLLSFKKVLACGMV